jgi:hypothetical protein
MKILAANIGLLDFVGSILMRFKASVGIISFLLAAFSLAANEEEPIFSISFRMMALPSIEDYNRTDLEGRDFIIRNVKYTSNGQSRTIPTVPFLSQSDEYRYRGPSPLVFYREVTDPDGVIRRRTLAEVDIANGSRNLLILALPRDNGNRNGFTTLTLADSLDTFPFNSFRIINFSSTRIASQLGDTREVLDPREEKIIKVSITEPRMVPFRLASYDPDSSQWSETSSTSVPFFGISRVLCLVMPDFSTRNVNSRPMIILDLGPKEEVE